MSTEKPTEKEKRAEQIDRHQRARRAAAAKAEAAARAEIVLKARLAGAQLWELRALAEELDWQIDKRELRRLIKAADAIAAEAAETDLEKIRVAHLARLRALFARAVDTGDLRTAHAVMKDEAKLRGLYDQVSQAEAEDIPDAELLRIAAGEEAEPDAGPGEGGIAATA